MFQFCVATARASVGRTPCFGAWRGPRVPLDDGSRRDGRSSRRHTGQGAREPSGCRRKKGGRCSAVRTAPAAPRRPGSPPNNRGLITPNQKVRRLRNLLLVKRGNAALENSSERVKRSESGRERGGGYSALGGGRQGGCVEDVRFWRFAVVPFSAVAGRSPVPGCRSPLTLLPAPDIKGRFVAAAPLVGSAFLSAARRSGTRVRSRDQEDEDDASAAGRTRASRRIERARPAWAQMGPSLSLVRTVPYVSD